MDLLIFVLELAAIGLVRGAVRGGHQKCLLLVYSAVSVVVKYRLVHVLQAPGTHLLSGLNAQCTVQFQ